MTTLDGYRGAYTYTVDVLPKRSNSPGGLVALEPPPRFAYERGLFGTARGQRLPFAAVPNALSLDGYQAARAQHRVAVELNRWLGSHRMSLSAWCAQHGLSYRRWGKILKGETWLALPDLAALAATITPIAARGWEHLTDPNP